MDAVRSSKKIFCPEAVGLGIWIRNDYSGPGTRAVALAQAMVVAFSRITVLEQVSD